MASGSNADRFMDEKKERRALANREAAKRSRIKKQNEWEAIVTERSEVLEDIKNKRIEIENYDNDYSMTEKENNSLDAGTLIVNKFLNCMSLYKKKLGIPDQTLETLAPTFNHWQSQFRH
ncbi:basic leucine zipper 4 [Quercus suber]|uniref:basic leucine zipper 4 n=1 Tax=Quercus suber TaxID=58331 RepID=UPI000CE20EA3|nr:basic leucine zipper 4-like [Quercus suber]POF22793.1 hypothetical protein CFP56_09769 [Quercus suber]